MAMWLSLWSRMRKRNRRARHYSEITKGIASWPPHISVVILSSVVIGGPTVSWTKQKMGQIPQQNRRKWKMLLTKRTKWKIKNKTRSVCCRLSGVRGPWDRAIRRFPFVVLFLFGATSMYGIHLLSTMKCWLATEAKKVVSLEIQLNSTLQSERKKQKEKWERQRESGCEWNGSNVLSLVLVATRLCSVQNLSLQQLTTTIHIHIRSFLMNI